MSYPRVPASTLNELVDATIDRYLCWREASAAVEVAYGRWVGGAHAERELLYAAYIGALDREERAAADYRDFVDRVSRSAPAPRRCETG